MIQLLIWLLILLIVLYVVKLVIDALPIPSNIKMIALLIIGLIFLLLILQRLGVLGGL